VKRIACVLATLWAAGTLGAADPPEAPPPADLGALLREAEASNPGLKAARARLESARLVPSQVQAPPDPEAGVAYTNDGVSSITLGDEIMSALSLTWTQEVPYPGKLRATGEVARREAEVAQKELDRVRLEIASAVKRAYADLYRLDRTEAILQETRIVLDSLAEAARKRYDVGEGIQESVFKAQTELLRLDTRLARVEGERRAAEARLNAVVGRPAGTHVGSADVLPSGSLPKDPDRLDEEAVTASPDVGRLEQAVRRGEASLDLARLELKPDFVWSASYVYRGDIDPMVMGMFGLRLPVYRARKQAQGVLQAQSDLTAAREDLADLRLRTRAAVRELVAGVRRAERLIVLFEQGVIPQAQGALESARASYGVGRIGFLDLLNDLIVLLETRIDLATEEADRLRSLAALEPLLARELIPVPESPGGQGGSDVP
jgi:outer membrane protein TolC